MQSGDDNPQGPARPIQKEVYYTNPARRDEDFTFNDKLKLQSVNTRVELASTNSNIFSAEDQWQRIASSLVTEINKINNEADWATKNNLQLIFAENAERILCGQSTVTH